MEDLGQYFCGCSLLPASKLEGHILQNEQLNLQNGDYPKMDGLNTMMVNLEDTLESKLGNFRHGLLLAIW